MSKLDELIEWHEKHATYYTDSAVLQQTHRDTAEALRLCRDVAEALVKSVHAMRAPLDDWKGHVEAAALEKANAALAAAKLSEARAMACELAMKKINEAKRLAADAGHDGEAMHGESKAILREIACSLEDVEAALAAAEKVVEAARNQPLEVSIASGRLIISIGVDTLAYAAERCLRFYDGERDRYTLTVTDKEKFATEVVRALQHEEEDGTTPLHVLLDDAFEAAVDDGCEGVALAACPPKTESEA